jgi:hypothetical protein
LAIPFAIYTIETGLCLLAIIIFVDETYYDRHMPVAAASSRGSKVMRMIGISQWRSHSQRISFREAMYRPFTVLFKAPVAICALYYMITMA